MEVVGVAVMPRDGAIIFRDIVGKLDVLRVECDKCGVSGGRVRTGGREPKIGKGHGPQTPNGLERCRRSSWKHGYYSAEAKAVRRNARLHLKALRRLMAIAER